MKKLAFMLLTVLLLAACAAPKPATVKEEEPFPDRIAELDGLTVDDVQAIWRFDDSQPPDTPARIVYREKDLKALLAALQAVRVTGLVKAKETAAPGDYWSYRVYLFGGKTVDIHFSSSRVISQGKNCSYQNSAPVQQVMDGLERDPYLLGNDAYETVGQVRIATEAGERTVTDRKQIEAYVRMFHGMTITGRSREPLAGRVAYAFRHKDGTEIVLKYQGNLLATAEGTYQVTTNPEYIVAEAAGK